MSYDPHVPVDLKKMQTWFAGVITDREIANDPLIHAYIKPGPCLKPQQRIHIYQQQYWSRILDEMHATFLIAVHLLGIERFNTLIAIPYLESFPSQHYSISYLGNRLPEWMRLYYQGSDKQLLSDAIAIDHAINQAFYRATLSPLAALERRAKLQPHVSLFRLEHNLFQVRDHLQLGNSCLVKKQDKASFFLVYRSRQLHIKWEEISEAEHTLLSQFQTPCSLEEMCEWLAEQGHEAPSHLQEWIQGWTAKQLLGQVQF